MNRSSATPSRQGRADRLLFARRPAQPGLARGAPAVARAGPGQSCAERFPAVEVCRPLLGRQIRRDDNFYAERAGDFERASGVVLDQVEAEMRAPGVRLC
jgi:hypothetical protein